MKKLILLLVLVITTVTITNAQGYYRNERARDNRIVRRIERREDRLTRYVDNHGYAFHHRY